MIAYKWQISFSLIIYLFMCLFVCLFNVLTWKNTMGSVYNKKNCMSLMAIGGHVQALLTFSSLASILIQKTTMSSACPSCRTCFPFMLPYFFLKSIRFKDGFAMDSITPLLCTPSLLPSVYSITGVYSSVFLLTCFLYLHFNEGCFLYPVTSFTLTWHGKDWHRLCFVSFIIGS